MHLHEVREVLLAWAAVGGPCIDDRILDRLVRHQALLELLPVQSFEFDFRSRLAVLGEGNLSKTEGRQAGYQEGRGKERCGKSHAILQRPGNDGVAGRTEPN